MVFIFGSFVVVFLVIGYMGINIFLKVVVNLFVSFVLVIKVIWMVIFFGLWLIYFVV